MTWLPLAVAIAGFAAGLVAAFYWYRASRVNFVPFWEANGGVEPVDPLQSAEHWVVALMKTGRKSGKLNRIAAVWTALSVLLSAISAVLGALAQPTEKATQRPEAMSFLWENSAADHTENHTRKRSS